jgi:hypothetical protein
LAVRALEGRSVNDSHVVALTYRIEHSESFGYTNAAPLEHEDPQFRIRVDEEMATVEMREHFDTPDAARALVEPFLWAWELDASLKFDDPNVLRFAYQDAEVVDRNPIPGLATLGAGKVTVTGQDLLVHQDLVQYPTPSANLSFSIEVDAIYDRVSRYRAGEIPLGPMADFCLTVLEKGGQRSAAAKKYNIDIKVLSHLGTLAAEKGGRAHSRKWKGWSSEYTDQERIWIEAAVKAIIRRAAEVAHDPRNAKHQITMADLPQR